MLTPPLRQDLADFMGVEVNTLRSHADLNLMQATVLFQVATAITEYPTDEMLLVLSQQGILEMAETLYSVHPYKAALATPFSSESIGSYSYSKAQKAITAGDMTGVAWFDIAVEKVSQRGLVEASSTTLFEEMPVWPADIGSDGLDRPWG